MRKTVLTAAIIIGLAMRNGYSECWQGIQHIINTKTSAPMVLFRVTSWFTDNMELKKNVQNINVAKPAAAKAYGENSKSPAMKLYKGDAG